MKDSYFYDRHSAKPQNVSGKVRTTTQTRNDKTKMISIDAYIYIIIGLLGVAYPVLLQVVARLDEKYSSDKIVELFDQEWESKAFPYSLYSSLFFIVVWSLKLPPIIHTGCWLDILINNSANLLVSINAILLVVFFFFYVKKILIYYTHTKLIPYLIKKHNEG